MATITLETRDLVDLLTDYLPRTEIGRVMEDLGLPGDETEFSIELVIRVETVPGSNGNIVDSIAEWARSELETTGTYIDEGEIEDILRIADVSLGNISIKKATSKKVPAKKAPAKKRAKKAPATKKAPARKRTIW